MAENVYNFKQRVTKTNTLVVNRVYIILPEPAPKSGKTMIVSSTFCKYVIQIWLGRVVDVYTHLLLYTVFIFYTMMRMYDFYGRIVTEIKTILSILFYSFS